MNVLLPVSRDPEAELLRDVADLAPAMRERRDRGDRCGCVPADDIAALGAAGALTAPLPRRHDGLGLGTEQGGGMTLFRLLRLVGSGNLSVGRLFEGHVNALALIGRYGTEEQVGKVADTVAAGGLFAIWNTEAPPGVRMREGVLEGQKLGGSGAGFVRAAVITVDQADSYRMLVVHPAVTQVAPMPGLLHGMRATQPGTIDFSGVRPDAGDWIGGPGDYLREPDFSGGAWRTLAVQLGGLHELTRELIAQLGARGRDKNTQQRTRIAAALIARETAELWVRRCATLVEDEPAATAEQTGYVNLARRAMEAATFEIIELTQRSLGLAGLIVGNPVEALIRDLATYLHQPAMDEAAAHFTAHPMPGARK